MKNYLAIIIVMVLCIGSNSGANADEVDYFNPSPTIVDVDHVYWWQNHYSINTIEGYGVKSLGNIGLNEVSINKSGVMSFNSGLDIDYISIQVKYVGFVAYEVATDGTGKYTVDLFSLFGNKTNNGVDSCSFGGYTFGEIKAYGINSEPNSVPVPAAGWLLGSGLIGFVGIRRKMKK